LCVRTGRSKGRLQRRRRDVAQAFDTVLLDVLRPVDAFTARAPVARAQVLDAQSEIEQLIAHLRDDVRRVDADALQLAEELLCDADGPLFVESSLLTLSARVRLVRIALG
jgi:hypothetical protein